MRTPTTRNVPLRAVFLVPALAVLLTVAAFAAPGDSSSYQRAVRQGVAQSTSFLATRISRRTEHVSACAASLPERLRSIGRVTQLVTVIAPRYATTYASLTAWQRKGDCWIRALGPWTARIGYAGFSNHHVEGDDTTPTGAYGVGSVMYGNAPNPGVRYRYHRLVCGDWWDETPGSPQYNTFQHVRCGQTPPFGAASEALWTESVAYPSFAVVDYNTSPIVPGAGSGIFIHANIGTPTHGCVSLPLGDLDSLLRWLNPTAAPLIVMGPSAEIDRF